jgi:uncharacterized protein YndB with AHSA1/START domain
MRDKPKFVYVIYIASTPEKVWQALTDPEVSQQYWFGFRIAASGKAGEHMTATDPKGEVVHRDPILESDPPRRLSYAWHPLYDDLKSERPSRVTIELTPVRDQVRLTLVHDEFDEGSVVYEKIIGGWPAVLSSLKSFLENGRGHAEPPWSPAAAADRQRRSA